MARRLAPWLSGGAAAAFACGLAGLLDPWFSAARTDGAKQRSPMASPSSLRGPAGLVEGMTLRQVQVICRHGARTPLTTEYGALEGCVWDDCKTVYKVSFGPPPLCAPSALLP
mmetsp:Transcript_58789/g.187649  ORF Transcript_58789/g.187649 Transcript_58789/m.187649 type:complete len:113 (-) Transcript_58789:1315-1653(-)